MKNLNHLRAESIKWENRAKEIQVLIDKIDYEEGMEDEIYYRQLSFITKECYSRALTYESEYLTLLTEGDHKELYPTPLN